MRKIVFIALLFSALVCACASADTVQGEWTGVGSALGQTAAVSASFDGRGGFTAFGMGMDVSGTYTLYEDSVTLSARNMSVSFAYSVDGSVETLMGAVTYMGVSGTITLTRQAEAAPAPQSAPDADGDYDVKDIYAVWRNDDSVLYSFAFYPSGYCLLSVEDTKASDDSLLADISGIAADDEYSIADLIATVTKDAREAYSYAAKFEADSRVIAIRVLDGDLSLASAPFFISSWDGRTKTLSVKYSLNDGIMTLYNAEGETLTLAASPIEGDTPSDKRFWRYMSAAVGDRGDNIELLQIKLIEKGFLSDKADGVFGNKTRKAIETLQEKNELQVTGAADEAVWDILLDGE